ncbi:MAG: hypothetical protein JWN40_2212 [Phycisphaerales bacterium]|nr:hypothetical protein [Phycisphaerales bacterium]
MNRLAKLERAAGKLISDRPCPQCGGTWGGVATIPMFTFNGVAYLGTFAPTGRCSTCGSVPSHVINLVTPLGGEGRGDAK